MKGGSISLARSLCVEIAGFTDENHDLDGNDYGSVDIAEILSAEVVRLRSLLKEKKATIHEEEGEIDMNLEQIKHDLFSFTDKEVISWLIDEVEKYQKLVAGNSQLQIDWVDVTSKRCAEIAEKHGCSQCMGIGSRCCAEAIREEFKVEE